MPCFPKENSESPLHGDFKYGMKIKFPYRNDGKRQVHFKICHIDVKESINQILISKMFHFSTVGEELSCNSIFHNRPASR